MTSLPPSSGGGSKKGEWHHNPDGSGYWSRVDLNCERYREPYACGPKRSEITRRITTNLATGAVLEDTDTFAHSTDRCAPIAPNPKDPRTPTEGVKFKIRTDFYYGSTSANVAAPGVDRTALREHSAAPDAMGNETGPGAIRGQTREPWAAPIARVEMEPCEPSAAILAREPANSGKGAESPSLRLATVDQDHTPDSTTVTAQAPPGATLPLAIRVSYQPRRPNFVEACCGPTSVLSQSYNMGRDFNCTRITELHDFASTKGQQMALDRLRGPGDVLWYASPCTGGCSWQRLHLWRGRPSTVAKITAHRELMRRLWTAFEHVAAIAEERGATVIIEWPRRCSYWTDEQVVAYIGGHGYESAIVHGCAVGLTSVRNDTRGALVRKAWRLATNNAALARRLSRTCPGDHRHITAEKADVKASENYSPEFAIHVREAIAAQCAPANPCSCCA